MKPVIFLGPTISVSEARAILDATYLPPVRQADLLSAIHRYRPQVVGIIDGFFSQDLPVWHKEILFAMEQGVQVFGASSMGALRAAELAAFGMQGVGRVFEQYASGALTDDDEVAVAHGPAELNYLKLSEPLVNIRATLEAAIDAGLLDPNEYGRVIAAAKAIYFPERTIDRILAELPASRFPQDRVRAIESILTGSYVDAKKNDAILLLQAIRDLPDPVPAARLPEKFQRSSLFETLYQRDRTGFHEGTEIRLSAVARYAALHYPGFEALRCNALNRKITALFGKVIGLEIQVEQVEQEIRRFRLAGGLSKDADFSDWLTRNDLSETDFRELMAELAECRQVQKWWLSTAGRRDQKCKLVLDQLRLAQDYEAVASAAARQGKERRADEDGAAMLPVAEFKDLVREHAAQTGFRIAMPIDQWAEEVGFLSLEDLQMDLLQARAWRGTHPTQNADCP